MDQNKPLKIQDLLNAPEIRVPVSRPLMEDGESLKSLMIGQAEETIKKALSPGNTIDPMSTLEAISRLLEDATYILAEGEFFEVWVIPPAVKSKDPLISAKTPVLIGTKSSSKQAEILRDNFISLVLSFVTLSIYHPNA